MKKLKREREEKAYCVVVYLAAEPMDSIYSLQSSPAVVSTKENHEHMRVVENILTHASDLVRVDQVETVKKN